jgi:hypothetical protein
MDTASRPLPDPDPDTLPTLEWLSHNAHQDLVEAALQRVANGRSTFADARLLAFEIGLAHAGATRH